jgi:hypothetical protein
MEKEKFIRTTFLVPEQTWNQVIEFNKKLHLSSDSAAARLLLVLGLKNEKTIKINELKSKKIKRTLELLPSLKADIKKFQHRHEVDESQIAICHLVAHGLTVIKQLIK